MGTNDFLMSEFFEAAVSDGSQQISFQRTFNGQVFAVFPQTEEEILHNILAAFPFFKENTAKEYKVFIILVEKKIKRPGISFFQSFQVDNILWHGFVFV